jgi:acylphosphatase
MKATIVRRIAVHGRVQGVGFRAFVADEAERHNLEGWVRNRRDGSVEAVIAGDTDAIATMIATCRRGPLGSRVENIYEMDAGPEDLALRPPGMRFAILKSA